MVMRSQDEILKLRKDWIKLRTDLLECGDTVSLIVAKQSLYFINTLNWVLGMDDLIE